MKWEESMPKQGDIVRVKINFYYHYGIFDDENHIIAFGLPDNSQTKPEDIAVVVTDVAVFLHGGSMQTAKLDFREKIRRKSVKETLAYAYSRVGTKNYHLLHNNCEHFVNECVFGTKKGKTHIS